MTHNLRIDFVSDVTCPWCAVGLASLEQALARVAPDIAAELHFQPFELNPRMGPEGQDAFEHLNEKYGTTREQQAESRAAIRERGAAVGFRFREEGRARVWNTFDAHRLLHWAEREDLHKQHALKKALLVATHGEGLNPSDPELLVRLAGEAGLDTARAREILDGGEFADDVRTQERLLQDAGIQAVPAIILNQRHLISGGQPVEVFERALRQVAGLDQAERVVT